MAAIVLPVALGASVAWAETKGMLDGAKLDSHIYGPKIKAKDVRGKVVFFEYWGIRCPPCRASFPHLVDMQKKYAATGRFTVVASHVQRDKAGAKRFCREKGVNFPVFHQLRLAGAPVGGGIPSAYLFDHKGNIVAKGHPTQLYGKVAKLVKAAPAPLSAIVSGVEIKHFKSAAKRLVPGKPVKATLAQLDKKSEGDTEAAAEANAIVESVRAWIARELARAKELSKTAPTEAVEQMDVLLKTVRGMEEAEQVEAMLEPLKADKNVMALGRLRRSVALLRKTIARRGLRKAEKRRAAQLKKKLEAFLEKEGVSEALTAEAVLLAKAL